MTSPTARTAAISVATALGSAVPLWRAPRAVRGALVAGSGLLTGGAAFVSLRTPEEIEADRQALSVPAAAGAGVAFGALAAGAVVAGLAVDREVERFLLRRGVGRPRLVMGVAAGALHWAIEGLERRVRVSR